MRTLDCDGVVEWMSELDQRWLEALCTALSLASVTTMSPCLPHYYLYLPGRSSAIALNKQGRWCWCWWKVWCSVM
jgi:hypothetical protein